MPAHMEIISPEKISLTNNGYGDILNELTRRLHGYDEVARVLQAEKQILTNQLEKLSAAFVENEFTEIVCFTNIDKLNYH